MIAGFFQFAPERAHPERNTERIERALRSTRLDLLVCPELALTGYLFSKREELRPLAEPVPGGPSLVRLARAAREAGTALVLGLAERDGDRLYNSAALLDRDGGATTYRKAHLFDTELLLFDRGGGPPPVVEVAGTKIGLMVCFDWRFPEMARLLALRGADLIAHPSNLVHPHCQDAMVTRSIENRVYSITASRTGSEKVGATTLRFTGRSQIVSPHGERLALADALEECVRTAEIDPSRARDKRVTSRNDLWADRRVDLFAPLLEPRGGAG